MIKLNNTYRQYKMMLSSDKLNDQLNTLDFQAISVECPCL